MRLLVLLVAALFVTGFAYLTVSTIAEQGLTLAGLLSVLILLLLGVGIVGALFNPPRK
jgi:hypothetical protein